MSAHDLPQLARDCPDAPLAPRCPEVLAAQLAAYCTAAATGCRNDEAAGRLAELLAPQLERAVRAVTVNGSRACRREFAQDALRLVMAPRSARSGPRICGYRPERGALQTWLVRVLRRCWADFLRERRRHRHTPLGDVSVPGDAETPNWSGLAGCPELTAPFSPGDLAVLHGWTATARLELLCLAGLWHKVPRLQWAAWLDDYEAARGLALPRPFPPPEFDWLEDRAARTGPLAALLGCPPNTLTQRWLRAERAGLLLRLAFVREVLRRD
jgi:DNA-directed RNA polymerase specialized sigma24 family protein